MDVRQDIDRVLRPARVSAGITKHSLGEMLIIEVDVTKATHKGRPYASLGIKGRQDLDDALYLSHIQEGNVKIIYK